MLRPASIADVRNIHSLLKVFGQRGELLPRPLAQLYDHLRDFTVCLDPAGRKVIGCCALQFCWDDLAEIRSLAVAPDAQGHGVGSRLVQNALDEARRFKIDNVFTLTYRPGFFERFGFSIIDRAELPLKIWADCITCVKFPDCDETAMMLRLVDHRFKVR